MDNVLKKSAFAKPAALKKRMTIPEKRSVNLAKTEEKSIRVSLVIPLTILVIAAAVIASKFAVIDRFVAVSDAEGEAMNVRIEVEEGYAKVESYGELTEKYAHYTFSGLTDEEKQRTNRVKVIRMMNEVIIDPETKLPMADIFSFSIKDNQLVMSVIVKTLDDGNAVVKRMLEQDCVAYCAIDTVKTNDKASLTEHAYADPDTVTVQITAYLVGSMEVKYDQ